MSLRREKNASKPEKNASKPPSQDTLQTPPEALKSPKFGPKVTKFRQKMDFSLPEPKTASGHRNTRLEQKNVKNGTTHYKMASNVPCQKRRF